ncbi:MAG: DMT family transporter [Alphaproteobacteria bacterium]|nr:DMT family transporter [Alphaproteobacteria bacterium]
MLSIIDRQMPKRTAMIVVLISSSVWGLLWLPLRFMEHQGLTGRWANGFFVLMPLPLLLWAYARPVLRDRANWGVYFWAGGVIGFGFMFYTLGLIIGSVTKTTLLFYLTPVWSSLLGMIFLGEKPKLALWVGNALGLTGCALILELSPSSLEIEAVDLLGLLSGIFWAIGAVIVRRYPEAHYTGITLVQYISSLMIAAGGVMIMGLEVPPVSAFVDSLPVAAGVSIFIILPALLFIFRTTQYISPAVVGILMLSEVFAAVISASILLDEHILPLQWLGAGLIILTAVIVTLSESAGSHSSSGD